MTNAKKWWRGNGAAVASLGILIVSTQLMLILCGYPTSNFFGPPTHTHKRKNALPEMANCVYVSGPFAVSSNRKSAEFLVLPQPVYKTLISLICGKDWSSFLFLFFILCLSLPIFFNVFANDCFLRYSAFSIDFPTISTSSWCVLVFSYSIGILFYD